MPASASPAGVTARRTHGAHSRDRRARRPPWNGENGRDRHGRSPRSARLFPQPRPRKKTASS